MNKKRILLVSCGFTLLILSCSLTTQSPPTPTPDNQAQIDLALTETSLAQTQMALNLQLTMASLVTNTPMPTFTSQSTFTSQPTYTLQYTYTPQFTYTLQASATSDSPKVSVSMATNCRTGPGDDYPIVGSLQVGQVADVVGRSQYNDSWIIRLPSNSAVICWLWAQYATVTGNTANLQLYYPPPTPTKTVASIVTLSITNNTGTDILFVYFTLATDPSWGPDRLGADTLNVGETFSWTILPGVYDVKAEYAGHVVAKVWYDLSIFTNTFLAVP